ncbi:Uroporphyrinogen-III C-methyltransferase [Novipirellula galeiformis]|uniref:uroporphyrinogen-III C-methyltransferase n=1 Tax=Novipirellula galeiformis TaxID=2528004 RepID=A0A5C6CKE0_9BACT|nr:uroporphyrinogen-III C-methyltransferase [Novipirellula galeiformis]TWU23924.1 Uroporphyrinogen-III C-methyltransferase [Novipirellula galeiformis]
MNSMVYLIGAGPGDPGLLTLRGAELLRRSDVVLYDGLSNAELLKHAPRAEHICVGKHGQQRIWRQEEIIEEMLKHARNGRVVARLKGGDPAVFARTAEEVDALSKAGIRYEIVPGITAALAAGSYAGIPITHRKLASAVALVTGHEEPGKPESALDWQALARFPGTLVIYMGVTTAETWTRSLIENGKPADTPVAIVRRCSHHDQQTFRCRLDEVADRLSPANKIRPPVIVIIGPVAELTETRNWLEQRPLFGQTVLVTRPIEQAEELASPLRDLGATVLIQPAIQIGPPGDWDEVDAAIESLAQQDIVIFFSRNGVQYFLQRVLETGRDMRAFANCKLTCVGKQTAAALADFHLHADIVPPDFTAESLVEELRGQVEGKRITIVRASRGRDLLYESLQQAGADVTQVVAYAHTDVTTPDPQVLQWAKQGQIDWITLTSSATAESLHQMLGESMQQAKLATLSPITSAAVRKLGYTVACEADPYTIESLIQALVKSNLT